LIEGLTSVGHSHSAALIDEARMMRNIAHQQRMGLACRVHTSRLRSASRSLDSGGHRGQRDHRITLKEAEQFFAAGFTTCMRCASRQRSRQALALVIRAAPDLCGLDAGGIQSSPRAGGAPST
jgi:D-serine deaminase-like pyridoxal phosphate-dependent protein